MATRAPFKEAKPYSSAFKKPPRLLAFLEKLSSLLSVQFSPFEFFFVNQWRPSGTQGKKLPSLLWRHHLLRSSNDQLLVGVFPLFQRYASLLQSQFRLIHGRFWVIRWILVNSGSQLLLFLGNLFLFNFEDQNQKPKGFFFKLPSEASP